MNDIKTCHICLEDKDYEEELLLKTCCQAFICNDCWTNLLQNDNINQCPTCSILITIPEEPPEQGHLISQNNIYNYCKSLFHRLSILVKWSLIGYTMTSLFMLILYRNLDDYFDIMYTLNNIIYFWPINLFLGYLITTMYEYYNNMTCQIWYNN